MVKEINFEILDSAVRQIEKIIEGEKENTHLRIDVLGGGCAGFSYNIDLDNNSVLKLKNKEKIFVNNIKNWSYKLPSKKYNVIDTKLNDLLVED